MFADDSYNVAATVDLLCKLGFDKSLSLINFKSNSKKKVSWFCHRFKRISVNSEKSNWVILKTK